jgi:hypothetical protein
MAKMSKMDLEIERFVKEHPQGWGHEDWLGFLHHLGETGQEVPDADSLGLALEKTRLRYTLQGLGVSGLGPKRMEAVCDAFPSLYHFCSSAPEEVAERAGIPRSMADSLLRALQ